MLFVAPAKAGVQGATAAAPALDSRFRGNDNYLLVSCVSFSLEDQDATRFLPNAAILEGICALRYKGYTASGFGEDD